MVEKKIIQEGEYNIYVEVNNGVINVNSKKVIPKELTTIPVNIKDKIVYLDQQLLDINIKIDALNPREILMIKGVGGVGKTTLVKLYLDEYSSSYDHVCWINVGSSVKRSFISSIELLDSLNIDAKLTKIDDLFDLVIHRMKQVKGNNLLIVDNANSDFEQSDIYDKVSLNSNWKVVGTSRENYSKCSIYEVKELDPFLSRDLFKMHYDYDQNEKVLNKILFEVNYHPLSIEVISKTSQIRMLTLERILEIVKKKDGGFKKQKKFDANVKVERLNHTSMKGYKAVLESMFDISRLNALETKIIYRLAILPAVNIVYKKGLISIVDIFGIDKREDLEINVPSALQNLVELGWINRIASEFYMHSFLQEVVLLKLRGASFNCSKIVHGLAEKLNVRANENPIDKVIFLEYSENIISKHRDDKYEMSHLTNRNSTIYMYLSEWSEALKYQKISLPIKKRLFKQNRIDGEKLSFTYANMAMIYKFIGNYKKAIKYAKKDINTKFKNGVNNLNLARSYGGLGLLYEDLADFKRSIKYHRLSIEIRERILNAEHPDYPMLATAYSNLSLALHRNMELEEAYQLQIKAIEIREKFIQSDSPNLSLAQSYSNLSNILRDQSDLSEAFKFAKLAMSIRENYSYDNLETANSYNNYGLLLYLSGRYVESLEYFDKGLKIRDGKLDRPHILIARSHINIARSKIGLRDYQYAKYSAEESLLDFKKILGDDHIEYLDALKVYHSIINENDAANIAPPPTG